MKARAYKRNPTAAAEMERQADKLVANGMAIELTGHEYPTTLAPTMLVSK